ncbi:MAG: DUF1559 domain-containing protein [Candidatus Hydrogenedentes bacterium]|nr:DUF1559 domain-containing protein [Candidatus Hydrogenedentota bacterium]
METSRLHLSGCTTCQAALDNELKLLSRLNVLSVEEAPSGLAERTVASVKIPRRSYVRPTAVAATIVLLSLPVLYALSKSREAARRSSTQGNMKQFGLIFKMYANESRGEDWPQLADADGAWVPDLAPWYGKLVTDPQFMVSEQHPDRNRLKKALAEAWSSPRPDFEKAEEIVGESFAYLGYSTKDEAEFEALMRARAEHRMPGEGTVPTGPGEPALQPLREGVERFMITDINNAGASSSAQSSIPVLIEIATWKHRKSDDDFKGTNVLYMDGHVAFVQLGTFPVLPSILDVLSGE